MFIGSLIHKGNRPPPRQNGVWDTYLGGPNMVNWGIPEKILHGFVYCEKFSFLLVWRRLQMSCKMTGDHRERLHERI